MSERGSVRSRDGSVIGYTTLGAGPPMVLVHGSIVDRRSWGEVRARLASRYTVHALDRRGRGLSTAENGPYDIAREGEDVAVVVAAAGRDVYVVAHSYGALCALEAALATDAIGRMLLYEPPFATPGQHVAPPAVRAGTRAALDAGDPDRAVEIFFADVLGLPPAEVDAMRGTRAWQAFLGNAPALAREGASVERFDPSSRLARITVPVRILVGANSAAYQRPAAEALAGQLPRADIVTLNGHGHLAIYDAPDVFTGAVLAFAS